MGQEEKFFFSFCDSSGRKGFFFAIHGGGKAFFLRFMKDERLFFTLHVEGKVFFNDSLGRKGFFLRFDS